jgi:hypothetical protein
VGCAGSSPFGEEVLIFSTNFDYNTPPANRQISTAFRPSLPPSVADPDPNPDLDLDPSDSYVFEPPGSGSGFASQSYGSGSGSCSGYGSFY